MYKFLPATANSRADATRVQHGSYAYQILSFIDQQPLHRMANGSGIGLPLAALAAYMCPGRGRRGFADAPAADTNRFGAQTDYGINPWLQLPNSGSPNGDLSGAASTLKSNLVQITDGTSNTILVGQQSIRTTHYSDGNAVVTSQLGSIFDDEVKGTTRQTGTFHRDYDFGYNAELFGDWGGPFPEGALMALCDGTVRAFPYFMGTAPTTPAAIAQGAHGIAAGNLKNLFMPGDGNPVTLPD